MDTRQHLGKVTTRALPGVARHPDEAELPPRVSLWPSSHETPSELTSPNATHIHAPPALLPGGWMPGEASAPPRSLPQHSRGPDRGAVHSQSRCNRPCRTAHLDQRPSSRTHGGTLTRSLCDPNMRGGICYKVQLLETFIPGKASSRH